MDYNKLITEAQDNNIGDMYDTFSHILADKVMNSIDARRATIASSLLEDCGCEACHAKDAKSKKKRKISESQRFGGDTNIDASPKIKKYIESGKGIIVDVQSTLHPTSRFAIYKNPTTGSGQDKVLMATISNPKRGKVKMFAFHGSHVSHQKAMQFAKNHKLVSTKDAKGNPLFAKESVELEEKVVKGEVAPFVVKQRDGNYVTQTQGKKIKYVGRELSKAQRFTKKDAEYFASRDRGSKVIKLDESVEQIDEKYLLASEDLAAVKKQAKQLANKFPTMRFYVIHNKKHVGFGERYEIVTNVNFHMYRNMPIQGQYDGKRFMNESVELDEATKIYQAKSRAEYQKLYGAATQAMYDKMLGKGGMVGDRSKLTVKMKFKDEKSRKKFERTNKSLISESIELDEATKWKMGDGRPRGGARIENVRFWDLSKDELQYIIKDAGEAMRANPKARKATTGPGNWADQVNDASTVLAWRKKNRIKESVELDECWDTHVQQGYKMKGGKRVPNCVPKNKVKESTIPQLQKSYASKMPVDINIDGNIIHVTPDISESLINLHDELNEDNQTKMRQMLTNSSSFVKLAKFAQER